jgi:hypothetical protein
VKALDKYSSTIFIPEIDLDVSDFWPKALASWINRRCANLFLVSGNNLSTSTVLGAISVSKSPFRLLRAFEALLFIAFGELLCLSGILTKGSPANKFGH